MVNQTYEDIWQTAYRAYILIQVDEPSNKVNMAKEIYALNEGLDRSNAFITRASVVAGDYDIVVPVYARSPENLEKVVDQILNQVGVNRDTSARLFIDMTLRSEEAHTPWPPHLAWGYIPMDEANPVNPGLTGFTPWG